jgi:hypothetical protein
MSLFDGIRVYMGIPCFWTDAEEEAVLTWLVVSYR